MFYIPYSGPTLKSSSGRKTLCETTYDRFWTGHTTKSVSQNYLRTLWYVSSNMTCHNMTCHRLKKKDKKRETVVSPAHFPYVYDCSIPQHPASRISRVKGTRRFSCWGFQRLFWASPWSDGSTHKVWKQIVKKRDSFPRPYPTLVHTCPYVYTYSMEVCFTYWGKGREERYVEFCVFPSLTGQPSRKDDNVTSLYDYRPQNCL